MKRGGAFAYIGGAGHRGFTVALLQGKSDGSAARESALAQAEI